MIKNYIIIGLILILIVFGISVSIKCSRLEKENIKLKTEQSTIIDSINIENDLLNKKILLLSDDIEYYQYKIDSLKQIKQRVIVKTKYVVSENLTESVNRLKENLKWEKQ